MLPGTSETDDASSSSSSRRSRHKSAGFKTDLLPTDLFNIGSLGEEMETHHTHRTEPNHPTTRPSSAMTSSSTSFNTIRNRLQQHITSVPGLATVSGDSEETDVQQLQEEKDDATLALLAFITHNTSWWRNK